MIQASKMFVVHDKHIKIYCTTGGAHKKWPLTHPHGHDTHTHLQGDMEWGYLHYLGQFDTPTGYMPFTKGVDS